jgi:hypothetical protein
MPPLAVRLALEIPLEGPAFLEPRRESAVHRRGCRTAREAQAEHLSQIVALLEERLGTNLTETNQLLLDQFERDRIADLDLAAQAKKDDLGNLGAAYDLELTERDVSWTNTDIEIFARILDAFDAADFLSEISARKVCGLLLERARRVEALP